MKSSISCILWLSFTVCVAQTARKYSNEFLNIGVDASALARSNAVVASTEDVNSGYWNPSGLVLLKDKQASFMHASYFANIANYDYLAFGLPLDEKSAVGFSLIRFGVDDILDTTRLVDADGNIDYTRINLFSAADYAFTFSYARRGFQGFRYGANAKIVRRIIGDFASSWGFGFDVAAQYELKQWLFGVMIRDITTSFNIWNIEDIATDDLNGDGIADSEQIPQLRDQELPEDTEITIPKLQIGVARNFQISNKFNLNTELDMIIRFTETSDIISSSVLSATPAFGASLSYNKRIELRLGVGNFQEQQQFNGTEIGFQPNIGVGFQYKGIYIDYALTDIGDQSIALYSNIFSIKLDWKIFNKSNQ